MGESILGVAVGTGAGRLDLGTVQNSKAKVNNAKHQAFIVILLIVILIVSKNYI